MNAIRVLGLFIFIAGGYFLVLNSCFKVKCYRIGMPLFIMGIAMNLLPLTVGGIL